MSGRALATPARGGRADDDLGLAVVDDVGRLVGRQVRVDARVVEAGALGPALALEQPRVVLDHEGDVVGSLQAEVAVEVGHPVGGRLVLGEGEHLAAVGHDDGGIVGTGLGVLAGVHGRRLTPRSTA
jgi:hypothetical protein